MKEEEIKQRIAVCVFCISLLQQEDVINDPRQPEALKYLQDQLAVLQARLPKPPPTAIGLKTATLTGKVPKIGE